MTREEAIAQLKMDRDLCNFNPMTGEEEPMNEDCRKSAEALEMAIKTLEQEPCEDGMEKHTDRQIYDGCIHLMQKMVDYFKEYLEYLGYDLDKLDEEDRFAVEISNMEIVRRLFLSNTRNSGGCSTRAFCGKIGLDATERVKFEFERDEE
jgi:hypothetical protein